MLNRPIAISLSPNAETDDIKAALKSILAMNKWQKGPSLHDLENWFKNKFKINDIFLFSSGRSALLCLLKSFKIGVGDEVIVQGFTCVAVPDPVKWVGAKPIYCDIDESLNINPSKLKKLISNKTRAIIVQHTFGVPAQIRMIKKITQKYNLILIEDCAHSLGASVENEKLGSFGDAAFFSFGRDKIISSVFGGAGIIKNNKKALNRLKNIYNSLPTVNNIWLLKQLLHPLLFFLILPLYDLYIGKILLLLFLKAKILTKPVEQIELSGGKPQFYPSRMPNALACLAFHQINKLNKFNLRRQKIAKFYFDRLKSLTFVKLPPDIKGSIYLRFNILVEERDDIYEYFRSKKIILGKWYADIIDPKGVNFNKI